VCSTLVKVPDISRAGMDPVVTSSPCVKRLRLSRIFGSSISIALPIKRRPRRTPITDSMIIDTIVRRQSFTISFRMNRRNS
jgi:hypothetical protein